MAEVTAMRNNALPYPVYGQPWTIVTTLRDADGDPVSAATTPDTEISKNGDTFADCVNEMTEIATNSGIYYITLSAAEMTADVVAVQFKSATAGMKTAVEILNPRKLVSLRAGTSQAGAAGTITLDSGASAVDDYYNGCMIVVLIDSASFEARIITDYVGSTKVASVTPNWNTNPDSDDTFTIYNPEGRQIVLADNVAFGGVGGTYSGGRPEVNASHAAGTAWNSGAIGPNTLAADTITAAKVAADVGTEIGTAVWATTARVLTANTNLNDLNAAGVRAAVGLASANLDTQLDALPTNAELATALGTADDAVLAAIAALNNLSQANIRTAVGLGSANLDTQLDALPTNAELATALGTADDAVLAAIAALNNLSQANIRTAVGLASANLDTQLDALPTNAELATALGTADDSVLAQLALVKAQTDKFVFTVANEVNANTRYVKGQEVVGSGTAGDPWGPV